MFRNHLTTRSSSKQRFHVNYSGSNYSRQGEYTAVTCVGRETEGVTSSSELQVAIARIPSEPIHDVEPSTICKESTSADIRGAGTSKESNQVGNIDVPGRDTSSVAEKFRNMKVSEVSVTTLKKLVLPSPSQKCVIR